jgi:hypothetical protein
MPHIERHLHARHNHQAAALADVLLQHRPEIAVGSHHADEADDLVVGEERLDLPARRAFGPFDVALENRARR